MNRTDEEGKEHFTLEVMGPVITEAMRAARNDELAEKAAYVRDPELQCCFPGCLLPAFRHRRHTSYSGEEEESNWIDVCHEHAKEDDEYWDERWQELYDDIRAGIAYGNRADRW